MNPECLDLREENHCCVLYNWAAGTKTSYYLNPIACRIQMAVVRAKKIATGVATLDVEAGGGMPEGLEARRLCCQQQR